MERTGQYTVKPHTNGTHALTLNEYQRLAGRTRKDDLERTQAEINAVLGIVGEAGEVADLIKKRVFHEHPTSRGMVEEELGDLLWYIAWLAALWDIPLGDVAAGNIAKLERRYPSGFDVERSVNRAEYEEEATNGHN